MPETASELVDEDLDEAADTVEEFLGRRWETLTVEFLLTNYSAVSIFTAGALAYYLPAYLLAIVEHYHEADLLPDELLQILCGTDADEAFLKEVSQHTTSSSSFRPAAEQLRQMMRDRGYADTRCTDLLGALSDSELAVLGEFTAWLERNHASDFLLSSLEAARNRVRAEQQRRTGC